MQSRRTPRSRTFPLSRLPSRIAVCAAALLSVISVSASASGQLRSPSAGAPRKLRIAILVYNGVQVQDFAGAFEVFTRLNRDSVFLVSPDGKPIRTWRGMGVIPDFTIATSPRPDVIVVPGGNPGPVGHDSTVLNWIRRTADSGYVMSVCSGAFLLLRAGVLDHRMATTFWRQQDALATQGAAQGVRVIPDRLVVEDGKVVTAAGTGIEGALLVLGRLHGEAWRRLTALHMEVNPDPELATTNRPRLADRNLPPSLDEVLPDDAELVDYSGGTDSWDLHWRYSSDDPLDAVTQRINSLLRDKEHWRRPGAGDEWDFTGIDRSDGHASVRVSKAGKRVDLTVQVWKAAPRDSS